MENNGTAGLTGLEIAVIGMACKFPGADSVEEFWQNLAEGVESITHYTAEELEAKGEDPALVNAPGYVRVARTIEGPDLFDAAFFNISPREAEILDPQKRLFLECAWHALENAGYDPEAYDGSIGAFAGEKLSSYMINLYSRPDVIQRMGEFQTQVANDKDYLATRIAYKLSLGGPSVTVQTACSTSLVAAHLACQSLLAGECDMALAGGVSVRADQAGYVSAEGEIFSPQGRIRAFDAAADGTIFGNGLGLVVLKRLEDALADRDPIRAVIKGSAINNDSSIKVGYTAPGADGQARVIRAAQSVAEVDVDTITYVEAHGTGTPTGDPIEISALTRAFRESTDNSGYCAVGSVKTNIGHLGAAAGVAGLIKTVLALEHKQLPPSLLYETPNPQIDFESSPFFINSELRDWPSNGTPLRAGVSAFGIGGTNAHAIVEEAPVGEPTSPSRPWQQLVLSARTDSALDSATAALAEHLKAHPKLDLADVAYTLKVGRRAFEHRRALVCRDLDDAVAALESVDPKRVKTLFSERKDRSVAFLFSGQGAQYPGMARGLYEAEPTFRDVVDRCCEQLRPALGLDLRDLLFPAVGDEEAAARTLEETRNAQPALFVVEVATARLLGSWGLVPDAMIGHSIGEYAAACLAGVFTLEEGLALVAARGRLMQSLPAGAMLAVPLSEAEIRQELDPALAIAAVNAAERTVVSGPEEAIQALEDRLKERRVRARRLHTSHAFHSAMMEPILQPFIDEVSRVELRAPQIPYVSNVTGTWITDEQATDPSYWAVHLRQAVRFADGAAELLQVPGRVLLEVGPGNTLAGLAQRHPEKGPDHLALPALRHPKSKDEDPAFLLGALGQLWLAGVPVDWPGFYRHEQRRRLPLPSYPFERRSYWIDRNQETDWTGAQSTRRKELTDWFYLPSWKPSVAPALPESAESAAKRWLLFVDDAGLGARIAERLGELGREVWTVAAGADFERLGERSWQIAPGERDHYERLLGELREAGSGDAAGVPGHVLHLWNVGSEDRSGGSETLDRSFYGLLYLTQALAKSGGLGEDGLSLAMVSSGIHRLATGGEGLYPEKAPLLGLCQVTPHEIPHLRTVAIDITLGEASDLVDSLIAEAAQPDPGAIVAYRDGERWLRGYDPTPVDRAAPDQLPIRPGSTVLITGGLGGFGLTFAGYLAREFKARLVLAGRSALPAPEEWDAWLAEHGDDDRTSRKIRRLQELEGLGAEVMAPSVDVTDPDEVRRLLGSVHERFGALDGVIHAAGLAGGGLIQLKTREMAEAVLAPKIQGTLALAEALGDRELDFFVLCSSTIATLGTVGQVDYCAANCFLDAFAESRAGHPSHTLSINWGAWQEVGMAVETAPPAGLRPAPAPEPAVEPAAAEVTTAEAVETVEPRAPVASPTDDGPPIHPLIDRLVEETADEVIYASDFEVSRHWVLDEHRILGNPAIPGTTHLELARAAYVHHTGGSEERAEVAGVFFFQPLMVPEGERIEARVILEKGPDAGFQFRVVSQASGPGDSAWTDHARGRVLPLAATEPRRLDLAEIRERCAEEHTIEGGALSEEGKLVYWGPRWQSLETIHLGDREGLARLTLPEEFASDLEHLALHPALLDVATALTSGLTEAGDSYLPLSYHRVQVLGRLPATFYSYLRLQGDAAGETVSADISLLDPDGRELVAIERFTMKRVGEARGRLAGSEPAAAESEAGAGQGLLAAGGMRPAEGVEALRRVLSRVRRPRIVVSPRSLEAMRQQTAAAAAAAAPQATAPESIHPRPNLATQYAEPSNEIERRLAEIWQDILGLEQVGVHDNFFELGGDSVLGITVISQSAEAGYQLAPENLFEHQTIAELAELLASQAASDAEQDGDLDESDLAPDELELVLAKLEEIA